MTGLGQNQPPTIDRLYPKATSTLQIANGSFAPQCRSFSQSTPATPEADIDSAHTTVEIAEQRTTPVGEVALKVLPQRRQQVFGSLHIRRIQALQQNAPQPVARARERCRSPLCPAISVAMSIAIRSSHARAR